MRARVYFATSSDIKFQQYASIAEDFDIEVVRGTVISSAMTEPQGSSHDIRELTNLVFHPLRLSARFISTAAQTPYFVEDTMLVIDALSNYSAGHIGLPGPDTKNWWLNLGAEGVLRVLQGADNRHAHFIAQIGVYYGAGRYSHHKSELPGFITNSVRSSEAAYKEFPITNPYFFHSIFGLTPDGPTLAELNSVSFKLYDYRRACFGKFAREVIKMRDLTHAEEAVEQLRLAL